MNKLKPKNIIFAALPIFLIPFLYWFVPFYRERISIYVPPCYIRFFIGIYCPGCGGTHCIYELAEGHILNALRYNALFFAAILYIILLWTENIFFVFGKNIKIIPRSKTFYRIALGTAVVYLILRNFIPLLAPV